MIARGAIHRCGFALVEVLVVIAIIAVLIGIFFPRATAHAFSHPISRHNAALVDGYAAFVLRPIACDSLHVLRDY